MLTAALCATVGFVVKSARSVYDISYAEQTVMLQRRATDHLLTSLLNAGTQAETATLQYADNRELKRYLQANAETDSALLRVKRLCTDTTQRLRLDTLQALINYRCSSTLDLIDALRKENKQGSSLQQQIKALKHSDKPVQMQVEVPVVERGEQIVIERRKKGFFRRLGDAFRRAKDDTVHTSVTQNEHVRHDTTRTNVNLGDTLAGILSTLHNDMANKSAAQQHRIYKKSDKLRNASAQLSAQISRTIDNFTTSQQQQLKQATLHEQARRTGAAWQLGMLALATTLLSAILFVWLWRDMKRANRYRKALEQAKTKAETLMQRREQLLLTISHDIKAPINTILGYLHMLTPAAANARSYEAIGASATHLKRLVTDLLDYHKLEAGGIVLTCDTINVETYINNIVRAFTPLAQAKQLAFNANVQVPPTLSISTDAYRLRQIVENLLSNAIKYTQQGSVSLDAHYNATAHQLTLSVSDTGCGMTRYDLDRIFEPFTRVKGSEGQEGTGLGLSITQRLVALLNAHLGVASHVGQGSRFTLTLPCSEVAPAVAAPQSDAAPATVPAASDKALVAIIDDDTLQLQLAEAMLHNVLPGGSIKAFTTPDALFAWLDEGHQPQWLFTDIEMPGMTGYELAEHLRTQLPQWHTPIVAMTSHIMLPVSHFKQKGFADVLFKPFNQNDLQRVFGAQPSAQPSALSHRHNNADGHEGAVPTDAMATPAAPSVQWPAFVAPLLAFAEGDAEAEAAIVKQFSTDCHTHLERIAAANAQHDKAALCQVAHKMLPTFTLIGSPVVTLLHKLDTQRAQPAWQSDDSEAAAQMRAELQRLIDSLEGGGL